MAMPSLALPGGVVVNPAEGAQIVYTDVSGALRVIAFDAVIRETHTGTADVTEHMVSSGAKKTDHIKPNTRKLSVEAEVTNTPIMAPSGVIGLSSPLSLTVGVRTFTRQASASGGGGFGSFGVSSARGTIGRTDPKVTPAQMQDKPSTLAAQTLQFPTPFDRVGDVFRALDQLRQFGEPVQVVTQLAQYSSMAIVSVVAPKGPEDSILFQLEFSEILTASVQIVDVPVSEVRGKPKAPAGAQGGYELPKDDRSTAQQIKEEGLGKVLGGLGL